MEMQVMYTVLRWTVISKEHSLQQQNLYVTWSLTTKVSVVTR